MIFNRRKYGSKKGTGVIHRYSIILIFKRIIAYCDLFLTFRGLGSEG